jgi:elongation factor Ts
MGQQLGLVIVNAPGASGDAQLSAIDGLTKKLAMHVVAAKPQYLSKDQVPADIVAKETEISKCVMQSNIHA